MSTEPVQPPPPKVLFKYCPPERIDILTNETIRFTPPNEFNDPFELRPRLPDATPEYIASWLNPAKQRAFVFAPPDPQISWQEFNRRLGDKGRPESDIAKQDFEKVQRKFVDAVQKDVSLVLGILSLSETKKNLLMWAHYCQRHTGFVLEFDTDHAFFHPRSHLIKVDYRPERPVFRPSPPDHKDFIHTVQTKSKDWEHESEWRLMRFGQELAASANVDAKTTHLMPLPIASVRAVYVGVRCAASHRERILSELKRPGRDHISLYDSELERSRFDIRFTQLRGND